jgi:oxidase EvaA
MDKLLLIDLLSSWVTYSDTIYRTEDILDWINEKNTTTRVDIVRNHLSDSEHWFYDKGTGKIIHKDGGFFSIAGIEHKSSDGILYSQPILIQDEIGYLGIIAKKIDGILYFLMQAKIEPGNINKIQISPTIQATRSNFTQIHGGKKPLYLDYFLNASPDKIIVDQLQSEQSSRFLKKRNRNICILLNENEDIEVSPNHRWLTLGQIKALMKIDNIVNMDTRTVLSCLPFHALPGTGDEEFKPFFAEEALYRSVFSGAEDYPIIYSRINNRKMFDNSHTSIVRLDELGDWEMDDDGIRSTRSADFDVIYCQIEIETGRLLIGRSLCSGRKVLLSSACSRR